MFKFYVENQMLYGSRTIQTVLADDGIRALAERIFNYDPLIWRHAIGTACVAEILLDDLKLCDSDRLDVITTALLHDIGETELPRDLFYKQHLSENDLKRLHKHPQIGAGLAGDCVNNHVLLMILSHHRTADRRGYGIGVPDLCTEIVKVSDVYSALMEERPYRRAFDLGETLLIMDELAGDGVLSPEVYAALRKYLCFADVSTMGTACKAV